MGSPSANPDSGWEELVRQVRELQARVGQLEARLGGESPRVIPIREEAAAEVPLPATPSLEETASALPVLGTALLGIAGAYLLRALTEFGTIPRPLGVAAGIIYAVVWLYLAVRTPAERKLTVGLYALTSVLVLAPLLWETVVRFQAMPAWLAALVLAFFAGVGLAISWRKNLASVAWITTLAGLGTAVVLLGATHDVLPFTLALLAIAALVEFSACWDHWLGERWVVAGAANLSVLFITYLVTRQEGLPEGYTAIPMLAALGTQVALLVIYLGSTVIRTLVRDLRFTFFETAQTVLAFLIALGGELRIAEGHPRAATAIGLVALTGGIACYIVAFAFLERRRAANSRNLYTYSSFALLLVLAGSRLLLEGTGLALAGGVLAVICLWIGAKAHRTTVRWHGALYLLLTAMASGLVGEAMEGLFGTGAQPWPLGAPALVCLSAAVLGYVADWLGQSHPAENWRDYVPMFLCAALSAFGLAAVVAGLLVWTWSPLAVTWRTAVLTIVAVVTAWTGRRWARGELTWLTAPLVLLTGYKILTVDLQHGQTHGLFLSLLLFGGSLVVLPKILRKPKSA